MAPNRHAYGVDGPGDDWRIEPGHPGNDREHGQRRILGVRSVYRVTALDRALTDTYRTDAHFVCYVVRDESGSPAIAQPRVNKGALSWVAALGYSITIDVLAADLDNPEHCDWTDELLEEAARQDLQLLAMGLGVYYTTHGRRVVATLSRPIEVGVDDVEGILAGWLAEIERVAGVHPDPSCTDWTRHFRLPHVQRSGTAYRSPIVRLEGMRPIEPPSPARSGRWVRRRASAPIGPVGDVAGAPLAQAFEAAGWLGRSLGAGKVAVLCPWRSEHTSGRDFDSSTILFGPSATRPLGWWHCSHGHCSGRRQAEVIAALPARARALLPVRDAPPVSTEQPVAPREHLPPDEARQRLEEAYRKAPDGLSLVVAGCGAGKSRAALVVAGERAATPYASENATGKRAPAHSKTSISVPTTRLAEEHATKLRASGTPVRRLFGPLSVKAEDGSWECRFHDPAVALSTAGLSVPWELCEGRGRMPCEHAETCRARGGSEGPHDARVTIGPHAMLPQLSALAGSTGLLVIDEPPDPIVHEVVTSAQVRAAFAELPRWVDHRYSAALRVSLQAIDAWIALGPIDVIGSLHRAVERVDPRLMEDAFHATGAENAIEAARRAFEDGHRGSAPPVSPSAVQMARGSIAIARVIGAMGRVARLVWVALTSKEGTVKARLEERRGERVLVLTTGDLDLRDALRREGACVIADANGRLHLPLYAGIVGYAPPVVEVHAEDGCEVSRSILRTRATRKGWAPRGQLEIGPALVRSVRAAVDWVLEDPLTRRVGIVTFASLEGALRAALGEGDPGAHPKAVALLGPELARLPEPPDLGHFGAIRGLDHWREHDALITLGDPWPQLTDARWESELLDLPNPEERYRARAAAELEQAHGRLRVVHRTRPARALHVGDVVPSGWSDVEERTLRVGRPVAPPSAALPPGRLQDVVAHLGGPTAASGVLGVSRGALARYVDGSRQVPPGVVARVLAVPAPSGPESRDVSERSYSGDCQEAYPEMSPKGPRDLILSLGPFGDISGVKVDSPPGGRRHGARATRPGRDVQPGRKAGGV